MGYIDKELTCSDCGASFVFDAAEQATFATLGYTNEPKRCRACRAERKARNGNAPTGSGFSNGLRPKRQMFPAKCSRCKKDTEVPFEPRGDRPVYCRECYTKELSSSPTRRY